MNDVISDLLRCHPYFFPYGFTSYHGLKLALPGNPAAFSTYTEDVPMTDKVLLCERKDTSNRRIIRIIGQAKYTDDLQVKYNRLAYEEVRIIRLSMKAFQILTNQIPAEDSLPPSSDRPFGYSNTRNKADIYNSVYEPEVCKNLYDLAKKENASEDDISAYRQMFLKAAYHHSLPIIAMEPVEASRVEIWTSLKDHTLYKAWKLSNIEALLRSNGLLTGIDRRPFLPYFDVLRNKEMLPWTETEIKPEEIQPNKNCPVIKQLISLRNNKKDYHSYITETINKWFSLYPKSMIYSDPFREIEYDFSGVIEPSFYHTDEFPGFKSVVNLSQEISEGGSLNTFQHSLLGVLIGQETTYIVHHTKPVRTCLTENKERQTVNVVEGIMEQISRAVKQPTLNRKVHSAIIVCPTVGQFTALFYKANKRFTVAKWSDSGSVNIAAPYYNANIVTMNHSGSYLFRLLAYRSPETIERDILNDLYDQEGNLLRSGLLSLREDPEDENSPHLFLPIKNSCFTLSHRGKLVLFAYTMDYQRIYSAWKHYCLGERFYILCFPEQVKFLKQLMPEAEFL